MALIRLRYLPTDVEHLGFFALSSASRGKPLTNMPLDDYLSKQSTPLVPRYFGGPLFIESYVISVAHARFAFTSDWSIVVYLCTLLLTALFGHD